MLLELEGYMPPEHLVDPEMKTTNADRFKANYPRVDKTFADRPEVHCAAKTVRDLTTVPDAVIHVNTNSAALTRIDSDVWTDRQSGCVVAYGHDGKEKLFAHVTPNDYLGYKHRGFPEAAQQQYVDVAVDRIVEPLKARGNPKDLKMVLLVNLAQENGGNYDRKQQEKDWLRLKQSFERYGMTVSIVELPLDSSAVLSSKENPDELTVVGQKASINARGTINSTDKNIEAYKVSLETASTRNNFLSRTRPAASQELAA
ncbi:MAG: hypothetical protein A2751_02765 [Candidatus Doudnabacteria bacterium RIFCSPHIGHO2_01_FULL_46_14]|uniref:Uncharacterized protein n=1 Tax=Candidatus Doudnabacteria bacterium RIFCSPHIGHO2_01_FULL_46_14 TaxID=1817824 RepID=A0A1F5NKL2_9BACT|nr:MAG: hypothetical protein A2751_02765 [Candidatus Doudnabacteria bacterium RIFCSPHIGHO2_01_FULL_46_14]